MALAVNHTAVGTTLTQSEYEAGSGAAHSVSGDEGLAKVWCSWEQTGAHGILSSENMTSVTDGGAVGDTDLVFDTDFTTAEWTLVSSANETNNVGATDSTRAAGTVSTKTFDNAGSDLDGAFNCIAIFGVLV